MVEVAVWHIHQKSCIRWAQLMLGTMFFSCCLKKMMNIKCVFKLYQQILLLVGEKVPWEHIWQRNVSNVFWKAFWSWQYTFVLDLLFGRHSDQALICLASITCCILRSHVKSTTISITRHFDHYLIMVPITLWSKVSLLLLSSVWLRLLWLILRSMY